MMQIDVAVAVIHYGDSFLLGFRHAKQHQGNRYEFVGGKIEVDELPKQALIREVYEEIGLDITVGSLINPLGVLRHTYHDLDAQKKSKTVCLHVYRVELTAAQYGDFRYRDKGGEGQSLHWADKAALLSGGYALPEANSTILKWLSLPDCITITQEITQIAEPDSTDVVEGFEDNSIKTWVDFYNQHLMNDACVYIRLKQSNTDQQIIAISELAKKRADISFIVNHTLANELINHHNNSKLISRLAAQHLTQADLDSLFSDRYQLDKVTVSHLAYLPLTISCHSENSVNKANLLAQFLLNQARVAQQTMPIVLGVFISPVNKTQTHSQQSALGFDKFDVLARKSEIPVIGLGGLAPNDVSQIRRYSGDKVAGIRKFLRVNAQQ